MEIELYNDVAFKWIFGRQERTKPLMSLLNAVIGHDGGEPVFEDIRIMNPFDMTKFSAEKYGILDIRVMDKRSGTWADVEIQVAYQSIYPERSMYYLAGMYRDQLRSGEDYEALRPCCGIHILLDDLFEDEPEWYNHYRMLNVRSHRSLSHHWEMYYIELGKFGKALKEGRIKQNDLAQWCDFISEPCDPSESLEDRFGDNPGIKEVFAMLQEFTEDDRLREQYRLHHEWLRSQRYEESAKKKLKEELAKERKLRKQEAREKEELKRQKEESDRKREESDREKEELKRQKEESDRKREESDREKEELKRQKEESDRKREESDREKEELKRQKEESDRKSILTLRKRGLSDKEIAETLDMPEDIVEQSRK